VIGALLGCAPVLLVPALGVWLLVVMMTGYVGLGTMLAVCAVPMAALILHTTLPASGLCLLAGLVVYAHRSNVARMRAGTENRANRLCLLRPRTPSDR
jgi:glycerol-3-phosphate acyltransferase PlsY